MKNLTYKQKAKKVSDTIKNHLIELGCKEVTPISYHEWELELNTQAGILNISVSKLSLQECKKDSLIMFHGRFTTPENFPSDFCSANCINKYSGKWNVYVKLSSEEELNNQLRYYSRMIPILECLD